MRAVATITLALLAIGAAHADDPKLTVGGKYEVYFLLGDNRGRAIGDERMSWGQLRLDYGPRWSLTATHWWYPGADFSTLDETYLQFDDGRFRASYGRIRPPFGLNSWSDEWYYGFNFVPMVQSNPLFGEYGLTLTTIGADAQYNDGPWQYQLAFTDTESTWDKLKPTNLSRAWGRVQWAGGPWILGASQTFDTRDTAHEFQRRGFDFRWSEPHIQFRGEVQHATDEQDHAWGYYAEAYYRPDWLKEVTLFSRTETFEKESGARTLYTLGAKKWLFEGMTASVNYVFGPSSWNASRGSGFSLQLLYAFSF